MSKESKNKWQLVVLDEVCNKIQDGAHNSPKVQFNEGGAGKFLYITSKNIRNNIIDLSNISYVDQSFHDLIYPRCTPEIGDVLLTKDGANTGNVTINTISEPFSLLSSVALIKTKPSILMPEFLKYYLQSPDGLNQLTGQMTGTAIKRIILRDLKAATIPLPQRAEQERIVAILDEAFEGIATAKANASRVQADAFELFESFAAGVFTARGKGWSQQRLDSVCNEITVGHVGSMSKEYRAAGIPFLRSQNIKPFQISLENVVYIDQAFNSALRKSQLNPGDLAIVRTGYPGTAAVIPEDLPISNCSDLVIVRPGPGLNSYYMAHFFNSAHGKRLVLGNIVGSTQKHFNIGAAKNVMVPIPSIPQQKQIVSMLDELQAETQRVEVRQSQKLIALEELKQSLLHQAFTGKL